MNRSIQPGLLRTFRYYTFVAMGYFAVVAIFMTLQNSQPAAPGLIQIYMNLLSNMGLAFFLSWSWFQRKLKHWFLPVSFAIAAGVPLFSYLVYNFEPVASDRSLVIVRSWLMFPILIVPLVLIAWQYQFRHVLLYTVFTTVVELLMLFPLIGPVDSQTLPVLGLPLIHAFSYGTVGHIVNHLVATQQRQSKALMKANFRLSQHAGTLEQLAVSRERNRLARELHDTLAHTLSGQAVNLEAIKLMIPEGHPEIIEMLDLALVNTRSGLSETRRALKDLRSLPLEDIGLALAVRNLARDAASRAGFALHLDIADTLPQLSHEKEQAVFRIVQESLENIVRHAEASLVEVNLSWKAGCFEMVVSDDGVGVELPFADFEDRLGLRGIEERAKEIGGDLAVSSQPGQGMVIRFTMEASDDQSPHL